MSVKAERRRVPVATMAGLVLCTVFVFEALVVGGVLEIRSSWISHHAPWAYEPFLRLVGEHPDHLAAREAARGGTPASAATVGGFPIEALAVPAVTNVLPATGPVLDPSIPVEPVPDPTNSIPSETVPVG